MITPTFKFSYTICSCVDSRGVVAGHGELHPSDELAACSSVQCVSVCVGRGDDRLDTFCCGIVHLLDCVLYCFHLLGLPPEHASARETEQCQCFGRVAHLCDSVGDAENFTVTHCMRVYVPVIRSLADRVYI
jgi:hypothetical protein